MEQNSKERIDRLHIPGLSIIQNKDYFCYGIDAVLLAHYATKYATVAPKDAVVEPVETTLKIIDLCTGNAIVPIIMTAKLSANFAALELQPQIADLARRSVQLNNLQDKIQVVEGDLKNTQQLFPQESFDMVTVNPPYMVSSRGRQSSNKVKMIARQELACTLKDVMESASYLLKQNGRMVMIHRPDRQSEIETLCIKNHLIIEEIIQIRPQSDKPSTMIVVIAQKSRWLSLSKPPSPIKTSTLTIYDQTHAYTKELKEIYNS